MNIYSFTINLGSTILPVIIAGSNLYPASAQGAPTEPYADTDTATNTHRLQELVVTGTADPTGKNLLPYTVTTIDASEIEATGNMQLLSAISGLTPSLFVTQRNIIGFGVSNGGAGHIKMRGVGGDRASSVLMMVDGQPQFAGLYSHHVADFYQTQYVERVEVLRGPASVLYGSNAMAGVINVITKTPHTQGVKTTISSQYGSYNTWLSQIANTTRFGRFSSLVTIGYDRTDGVRRNFDFSQVDAYAKISYGLSDRWEIRADYSFVKSGGNDPVYPTLADPASTDIYHQNIIRGEASLTATNRYRSTNGAARLYYSYGNHFIDDPRHFHSLDDRAGLIIYQNIDTWQGGRATLGFDFDRYTGKIPVSGGRPHTEGSLTTIERKAITEYSPYITFSQSLLHRRMTIDAGVRMAASDMFSTRWIPQGGISFAPGRDWHIKASVAKGFRNPSFRELYLYRFANPDLEPEEMMNYEISVGKSYGPVFSADITAYMAHGSDMIQTLDMKNVNTSSFTNKGIELTATSHPAPGIILRASYSLLHTSLKNLTGAPRHQYCLTAGWDPVKGLHADMTLKGVEGLYVAEGIKRQSYATLDLRLAYRVIRQLQLFVNLDNITNARYIVNRGYPMPGFTAMGGFNFEI